MTISHIAIIGAGLAGARSATALRNAGYSHRITIIGSEAHDPYDRPPLSKELLSRAEPAWLRDEVGADVHAAADEVLLSEPVLGIAQGSGGWRITTHRRELTADAVIAATGAYARRPSTWDGALTLHTAEDAAELRSRLTPDSSLICIGAGWIGAEVSGVVAASGSDVTVVEAGPAPLLTALGADVGTRTAPWYAAAGVSLLTGTTVAHTTASSVTLADGRTLAADVILAAVGVAPITQWLTSTGVEVSVSGHVVVGSDQRTSIPGLWAVGDCTIRQSSVHGEVIGGHWDAALQDPERAAASILGLDIPAEPAPYVFSTQLGHDLGLLGSPQRGVRWTLRGDSSGPWSALWFNADDLLVASFSADRPRDIVDARRLLAAGPRRVDEVIAADISRRLRDAALA